MLFVPWSNAQNIATGREANRVVALTFDDLPEVFSRDIATMRRNTAELMRVLKQHRAPAIGFVNEGKLHVPGEIDSRIEILKQWVDAGMTLGNHTFSHLRLFTTPLLKYEDDVIKGEVVTRRLMNEHQPINSISVILIPAPDRTKKSKRRSNAFCTNEVIRSRRSPSRTQITSSIRFTRTPGVTKTVH